MSLDNFLVRPKRRYVEKFAEPQAWTKLGLDDRHELTEHLAGLPSALDPGTVVRTAQTIRGVAVWEPWALPRALDFLRRRRHAYPFHKIVSDVFPFADIDGAFRRAETGSAIRVSLSMA